MVDPQAYAASQATGQNMGWYNSCQRFVRTALGFSGGVPGGGSARDEYQWTLNQGNIRQGTPPANVPVYFNTKGNAGHVALSAGEGYAWTTDLAGTGTVSLQKISDIAKWAGPVMGWGTSEGNTALDGASATDTTAADTTAADSVSFWNKLPKDVQKEFEGMGAGAATVLGFFGLKKGGAKAVSGVASAAEGAATKAAIGVGIIAAVKGVFGDDLKGFAFRVLAAIGGALLILMALYKLSGVSAAPVPV